MDAVIQCSRCGKQPATVTAFVTPWVVVDAVRCGHCHTIICGEEQRRAIHMPRLRRHPPALPGSNS